MTLDDIITAIRKRARIWIDYDPGVRLVEPHAVGRSREGKLLLRAFQTQGASASGEHVNWKLLRLDRLKSYSPSEETFDGPRGGYKRGDSAMKGGILEEL